VEFRVEKAGSPGDWVVSVNAVDDFGIPINVVLASTTVPNGSVPDGLSTLTANFASPADVTAGQNYAVVVTRPDSDDLGTGYRNTDVCPGDAFTSDSQTGAFTQQCTGVLRCDLVVAVFVEPTPESVSVPVPGPKAARVLTLDANKGKVEKGKKVRLSGELEATGNDPACEAGQAVEIQRTGVKGGPPQLVATVPTDAQGNYATKLKVAKSSLFTGTTAETAACEQETSDTNKVRVQKPKAAKEP
jgi:hypothetical protein